MNCRLFLFLLIVSFVTHTQAQSTSLANFIHCIDAQNGTDNLVVNGRPYFPTNLRADGHPYFQKEDWKAGVLYINGSDYSVDQLKYNLSNYQLIVKHERPNGTTQKVVLSDLLIDSFLLEDHLFVNRNLLLPGKENNGYLEKIFIDQLSFYRLQRKLFTAIYNKSTPHGQFQNKKDIYYLLLGGKYYKVTKRKEFLACFPNEKKQIKKYIKDHSLHWKKMTKVQLYHLLKFCNDQI